MFAVQVKPIWCNFIRDRNMSVDWHNSLQGHLRCDVDQLKFKIKKNWNLTGYSTKPYLEKAPYREILMHIQQWIIFLIFLLLVQPTSVCLCVCIFPNAVCISFMSPQSYANFHNIFLTVESSLRTKYSFLKLVNMFFYLHLVLQFCQYRLQSL